MTGQDGFDRTLAAWFEADALSLTPAGGLDRVLEATRRRSPRPAWLAGPGSHWVGEAHDAGSGSRVSWLPRVGLRWSTALVLLLALAVVLGGAILVGARLLQPSPAPAGRLGHLAYALDGDIFVADWDARNPVRIADGLLPPVGQDPAGCGFFWADGPMWSPDGRHVAYRSAWDEVCHPTVYISDPAGHVVASFPGTGWHISWSPDSNRVATWLELSQTIGIYGLDGVRQALLSVPPGCPMPGDFDPVWSPDGRSLLVWPCEVPLGGRTPQRVPASDPRSHMGVAYSPDGARVAFIKGCQCPRLGAGSLVVAASDGSHDRVLIADGVMDGSLVWSPTSDRVAFTGRGGRPPSAAQLVDELRVVDVASGTVTTLASARWTEFLQVIGFSPDGDRILFWIADANYVARSLWSVRADGSDTRLLLPATDWGDFDWQPLPAAR